MRVPSASWCTALALAILWSAGNRAGAAPPVDAPFAGPSLAVVPEDPLDTAWSTTFSVPGVTGAVNCMTSFDGALALGGRFDYAGTIAARGVALWDAAGWHAIGDTDFGEAVDVRALVVFRNQLVAAGSARSRTGFRAPFVQTWNGSTWTVLQSPGDASSESGVFAAAVYHGDLFVAGRFTVMGGVPCNNIARWDGTQWHPVGEGTAGNSGLVTSLALFGDELVAAGDFTRAGGQFASRVARWNGSEWRTIGYGVLGTVECIAVYHDELIAGGWFDYAEGRPARRIARWNGTSWNPLGAGIESPDDASPVYALGEMNGVLVVGGIFERGGSSNVAFWNGSTWSAPPRGVEPGFGFSYVRAFHSHAGQTFVAGWFTRAGGDRAVNIARLDPDGSFHTLGGGQGISGAVATLARDDTGGIVAGGWFDWAGTTRARALARWDGARWSAYGAGFDHPVAAVLQTPGGLVVGGDFVASGTVLVRRVALWKGAVWEPMGAGFNSPVAALVSYQGEVIAGGDFTASGATPLFGIARWDGSSWQAVGPEFPGATGVVVRALAAHGDDLYAAGWLYKDDGPSREFVAHWDGVVWNVVDAPAATAVLAMVFAGDDLIIGVAASQEPPMDLVWTWDGKQWNTVGNLLDGWVTALTVQDGTLYAGTTNNAQEDGNLWAWTGSEWTPLASRVQGGVRALLPVDGGMYAGGTFDRVGTRPAGSIAFRSSLAVPVEITDLRAAGAAGGVLLEWNCLQPTDGPSAVRVERAEDATGPFAAVSEWLEPARSMQFQDVSVQEGRWYWYRVAVRDGAGLVHASPAVGIEYAPARAAGVWLAPPAHTGSGAIELRYSAGAQPGRVTLVIHDVRGRTVRRLVQEPVSPGVHTAAWDRTGAGGRPVARGIYFARLDAAGVVRTVRVPVMSR